MIAGSDSSVSAPCREPAIDAGLVPAWGWTLVAMLYTLGRLMGLRRPPVRARFAAAFVDHAPDWSAMMMTQLMGKAARLPLPQPLSRAVVASYARFFDVEMAEVEPDALAAGYRSFDAFFTRTLKDGARPVDADPSIITSPSDGNLRDSAELGAGSEIVAKGHNFTLEELLGDAELARSFEGGRQTTIYLHPRDYHRVHSPCDGEVEEVVAVPGRLLPVTDAAVERKPELFALNERLIHVMNTSWGRVAVVMVAAFGVGHMTCSYSEISTHPKELTRVGCSPAIKRTKGEELGIFHLGSTVIVVTPRGIEPVRGLKPGPLRMGQALLQGEGMK